MCDIRQERSDGTVVPEIAAPPFPRSLTWLNVATLRMDQQRGRPVLVEFWDFCRVNSLRTLPYLLAWHERYAENGLRVIGAHAAGFPCSREPEAVRAAVERLGIPYAVAVDEQYELWNLYGCEGWPSRYLWDQEGQLVEAHFGEGGYAATERLIGRLLGVEREPLAPVRPEDDPAALVVPQSEDRAGPWSGRYAAGEVWAVLEGTGEVRANGQAIAVTHPGAYPLVRHPVHTEADLDLEVGDGVICHAVCFTPGLASEE
jgi:mannose-6-phosphate isomerase-like protein (cupin superfamily)